VATFVLNVPIALLIAATVVEMFTSAAVVVVVVLNSATIAVPFGSTLANT
jgi:hypothetical protein